MLKQWWGKRVWLLLTLWSVSVSPKAQNDSIPKHRLRNYIIAESASYAAGMVGFYQLWYKDNHTSSFYLFNDGEEWMQMDKLGHAQSSWLLSDLFFQGYIWSGLDRKKSANVSALQGLGFLTSLEILDGFSDGWGFSLWDMGANSAGIGMWWLQERCWNEQRIKWKFSFLPTDIAHHRPELLGTSFLTSLFKDYNGQSYWLSASPGTFGWSSFPKWLCFSLGYGADGMTGGSGNVLINKAGNALPSFDRVRQFYFSLDLDLSYIKTRKKWQRVLLYGLNAVKVPFPALQISGKNVGINWMGW